MKRIVALFVAVAFGSLVLSAQAAGASGSYDPNLTRIANPANVCKSIPGSAERAGEMLGFPVDTSSFNYSSCVQMLARGEAFVEPASEFGSPYLQCDRLLDFGLSYPHTFHDTDSFEDQILPDLVAKNRKECGSALYAFHSIFNFFPAGP